MIDIITLSCLQSIKRSVWRHHTKWYNSSFFFFSCF